MKQQLPDRSVIVGVAVAIIVAVVTAFATNPSSGVVLGIAIGLAGTTLALQINTLAKLDRASQLESALTAVPWLRPLVARIAASAANAETDERLEPFRAHAQSEIKGCLNSLEDIARGQLRATVGEGILERRTDQARKSLIATSIQQMDVPRWQSDLGKKYWRANINAINRGVSIGRVFIYRDWNDDLRRLVEDQVKHGVRAYVVDREIVPANLMIDMAVWDNAFTYQFELNSEGEPINNLYSVNEVDIARRVEQFEVVRALAREIEAPAAPAPT